MKRFIHAVLLRSFVVFAIDHQPAHHYLLGQDISEVVQQRDLQQGFCCLCDSLTCFPHEDKIGLILDEDGTECADVQQSIALLAESNDDCAAARTSFREICCTSQETFPATSVPVQSPPTVTQQGNEPVCHICPNETFPGKPNVIITSQSLDEPKNCGELYDMGKNGFIDFGFCYILTLFATENCCQGPEPSMFPSVVPTVSLRPSQTPSQEPERCKEYAESCESAGQCCDSDHVCHWSGIFKRCRPDPSSSVTRSEKSGMRTRTSNGRVRGQTGRGPRS